MSRPATRLLTVLELLQARGRVGGAELAERLDVDRRTVRRYIARLEALGIPITAEQGRDGAYLLVAGFKLPPMMFTDDEALALSVGLLAARGLGLAEGAPAVASAQAKLERVLPAPVKRRVRAVDETVTLDLSRPIAPDDNAALATLSAAAQRQTRVHLRYLAAAQGEGEREATARDFDPYGLAYRSGRWYALGMCHLRGGLRSFRLDRVQSVEPREVAFERPADFDALGHLTLSVASLPRAHAIEVLLRTDLPTARRALFASAGVLEPVADGVRMHAQADDLHWFARELARLPFPFEIRRPSALNAALHALATHLLRLSKGGSTSRRRT